MTDRTGSGTRDARHPRLDVRMIRPRTRVDRFAALVEETGAGRHHRRPVDTDQELLALVGVAHRLGRVPQPSAREQFREDLHTRLLAEFARQREPAEQPVERDLAAEKTQVVRQLRPRVSARARLAAVIGVATGALALSGVSLASGDAMPGDPLYSVKRSGEQAQLVLAGSDADRGALHLEFARTRLAEARQVAPQAVGAVLAEMNRQITEGARLLFSAGMERGSVDPINTVAAFVTEQRAELIELRAWVPAPDDPARQSLDLLDSVELRADELRAALADGCTAVTIDRFGPRPAC